jgi:hypothetical protein
VENEVIEFRSRTYQEVFQSLQEWPEPAGGWSVYMNGRYFSIDAN